MKQIKFTDRNQRSVSRWDKIAENPAEFWDSLTPQQRQRLFENRFYSFKTWERLSVDERRRVQELAKNQADCAFICGTVEDVVDFLGGAQ